jgi:hypothetical protein
LSIEKVRIFLEKSGCAIFVSIAIVLVLVLGMARMSCQKTPVHAGLEASLIADIKGFPITSTQLESTLQKVLQQNSQFGPAGPMQEFQERNKLLASAISQGLILHLAKEKKISFDDEQILGTINQQFNQQLAQMKEQAVAQGLLKKGFTDKEFSALLKEKTNGQITDIKAFQKKEEDNLKAKLKDPLTRTEIEATLAPSALIDKLSKQIKVTESEVRESYRELTLKQIPFVESPTDSTLTASPKQRAGEVLKDIKAGKISFEAAMDKYIPGESHDGKKKSESSMPITIAQIKNNAELKPLLTMKENEISPVINLGATPMIFKVVKIGSALPKDFDKKKIAYENQYAKMQAEKQVSDELKALQKNKSLITWKSSVYQLAYEMSLSLSESNGDKQKAKDIFQSSYDKLQKVKTTPNDSRAAAQFRYALVGQLWASAPEKEKAGFIEKRIEAINILLNQEKTESVELRLELVQMLLDKKDKGAGNELLHAAEANNTFDPMAQMANAKIESFYKNVKEAKLITPEQEKKIDIELARWKKDKAENDAYQEKQRKEMEAEMKKQQEEDKKKKKNSSSKAVKPEPAKAQTAKTDDKTAEKKKTQ